MDRLNLVKSKKWPHVEIGPSITRPRAAPKLLMLLDRRGRNSEIHSTPVDPTSTRLEYGDRPSSEGKVVEGETNFLCADNHNLGSDLEFTGMLFALICWMGK